LARLTGFAVFALLDRFILPDFVRYRAAACAHGASDECALTSASQTTDDSTASSRPADDLCSGVFLMIAGGLFADRAVVRFLPGFRSAGQMRREEAR